MFIRKAHFQAFVIWYLPLFYINPPTHANPHHNLESLGPRASCSA